MTSATAAGGSASAATGPASSSACRKKGFPAVRAASARTSCSGTSLAGLRHEGRDLRHVEPVQVEARERRRGAEPGDGRGAGARP